MWRIVSEAQRRLRIQSQPLSFAVKRVGKPGAVAWGQGKGPPLACFPCGMLKIPFRGEGGDEWYHSIVYANENEQRN